MSRKKYINEIYDYVENELELDGVIPIATGVCSVLLTSDDSPFQIGFDYEIRTDDDYNLKLISLDVTYVGYAPHGEITDPKLEQKIKNVLFNQIIDKIN